MARKMNAAFMGDEGVGLRRKQLVGISWRGGHGRKIHCFLFIGMNVCIRVALQLEELVNIS